jgi:hypothetical protein
MSLSLHPPTPRSPSLSYVRSQIIAFLNSRNGDAPAKEVHDHIGTTNDWTNKSFPSTAAEASYLISAYKSLLRDGSLVEYIDESYPATDYCRVRIEPLKALLHEASTSP